MKHVGMVVSVFLQVTLFGLSGGWVTSSFAQDLWFEQVFDTGSYNMAFTQDSDGFLWLTTTGGLIRYDGYEKLVFTEGPEGLSSNFVPCVFEDSDGLLWIVTLTGLDLYDKTTGKISHIQPEPHAPGTMGSATYNWAPRLVAEDKSGNIWIGSTKGLLRYDKEQDTFHRFTHSPGDTEGLGDNNIWTVMADRQGRIWIGTASGLDRYDPTTQTFTHFRHHPMNPGSLGPGNVYAVFEDSRGTIWVGTGKGGLNRYNEEKEAFVAYTHDPDDSTTIAHDEVFSITGDQAGNIWLGRTFSNSVGLEKFNPSSERFTLYTHDGSREGTLSGDIILSCFEDRSGILWVPENTGIVNKYDPYSHRFTLHQVSSKREETKGLSGLTSVYQDSRGDIWTGGQRGLSRYDTEKETWSSFPIDPDSPDLLWNNYTFSVLEDSRGDFWVATDDGYLNLFDRDKGVVKERYRNPYVQNTARQMIEDRTRPGVFWFGVEGDGLFSFNRNTGEFTRFASDPDDPAKLGNEYVQTLLQDEDNIIWVQSQGGLHRFDPESGLFKRYVHDPYDPRSISSNVVNDLYIDGEDNFWVSTDNGLNLFDRQKEIFTRYGRENGFTTLVIRAIVEDDNGILWLGSNDGLFAFDPRIEQVLHNYSEADGLQGDSFSLYGCSAMKDDEGRLWFAGLGGVNSFFPDRLQHNTNPPPVYLLNLSQGGEELVPRLMVGAIKELSLGWRHNYFEFEYVGLNYSQPQKNQYKYTLEGWDNDWYVAGNKRFGRYSGLSGGEYVLKVLAANNDGVWSKKPTTLRIHVEAPFWQTWWFYTLVVLAGIGFFLVFYFVRVRQLTRFNVELERAYKEVQTAENKYRSIFENAMDGIFQLTVDGAVISANPAAVSIMGFSGAEEMKREVVNPRKWVFCSDSQWRRLVRNIFKDGAVAGYELQVARKSGERIWISINLRLITDQSGIRYVDGLMEDITARKNTAEQLQLYREHLEQLVDERTREYQRTNIDLQKEIQERERIEEELLKARKLESIGVLAGGIAHDFNNLMTIILGNINIAQLRAGDDIAEELQIAVQAVNRAKKLTDKFITFSSGGEPVKNTVDIEALTRSAVELALSGSNLQARFNCAEGLHQVSVDRRHISQAMNSIVANSKQAMPDGGLLEVRMNNIQDEAVGECVVIDFIDHGTGITPENLPKVFDPYFTTAELGSKKGKGLGLTIAYSIVKKHQGTLSIQSTPGEGTRVRMLLPAAEADSAVPQGKKEASTARTGRILVMDDESMIRELATAMMGELGYSVDTTADGSSAMALYAQALAEERAYDLVILDLTIPGGMGGKEVVSSLRQLDPDVKAVVSSGYAGDPVVAEYHRYGFVEALSKPYDMAGLEEMFGRVLD